MLAGRAWRGGVDDDDGDCLVDIDVIYPVRYR